MTPKINISEYETKILKLQEHIQAYKPLSEKKLQNLKDWFNIGFTAHSNAIE